MKAMLYIDGTNFLTQLAKALQIELRVEKLPEQAVISGSGLLEETLFHSGWQSLQRRYWYGSYIGSGEDYDKHRTVLRSRGYQPTLVKRHNGKEKGVDISLTKDMLINAFQKNSDTIYLVAGDADYVPLVEAVKAYDQQVHGYFFKSTASEELILACDKFHDLDMQIKRPTVIGAMERLKEFAQQGA